MAFNWKKFPWTNLHDLNLDWIIQTVKTLENNLADAVSTFKEMIDTAVGPVRTALATETENRKAGDAAIQTTIENEIKPKLATETVNRKAGDAAIQTTIENEIKPKLATETENRKAGDAALQSTIDSVIMPRLDSLSASSNSYVLLVNGTVSTGSSIPLTAEQVTDLQDAAQNNYPITLILRDGEYYTALYPFLVESNSMRFARVCNFNSLDGHVDVNQALGRMIVASIDINDSAGTVSFIEYASGLTRFLPCSISITWTENANSYTLTDKEYAILRQSLLDKRPIFIVRNTADVGGEQTTYILYECVTPSTINVDSMTLVLHSSTSSIKIQMASKTIVPNIE